MTAFGGEPAPLIGDMLPRVASRTPDIVSPRFAGLRTEVSIVLGRDHDCVRAHIRDVREDLDSRRYEDSTPRDTSLR